MRGNLWVLIGTYGNFVRGNLWELEGAYGNFVRGNLWELMGTYGNLRELMGTYGMIDLNNSYYRVGDAKRNSRNVFYKTIHQTKNATKDQKCQLEILSLQFEILRYVGSLNVLI